MALPKELVVIATRYRGPGCEVCPSRLRPPSTHERMQELVDEGWLTKRVLCRENGDPHTADTTYTTYATTAKTHDMQMAKVAISTSQLASISEDLGGLLTTLRGLEEGGLDAVFAKRCELAKLALDARMAGGALDYYLDSMRKHRS